MSGTVAVLSLGGTIAMTPGTGGVVPTLGAADLVAAVPGLEDFDVREQDVRRLPGASLTFADVVEALAAARAQAPAGVVITQGTDTIEETAWLLDLLHAGPQPLVVTGAMRHPSQAGADGPANLLAAVQVATAPAARDLGCLVVLANEIHAARWVRKTHATSVAAFTSPGRGPIGHVAEGVATIWGRPRRLPALPAPGRAVRVPLVTMTLDDDGSLLESLDADGLVLAGFGVGHVPARLVGVVEDLAQRMPVVLTSRAGAGPVGTATYAFEGSEADLLARNLIRGGYLDPLKARVLLRLLVASGAGRDRIVEAFAAAGDLVS
jgi:L-asparaginase